MKIGIFSDVHGHLTELEKTLALFDYLQVDHLLCCGDLVDKGRESDAVVSLMQEQAIPCIQGNHDFKAQFTWFTHHGMLSSKTIDYLSKLPPALNVQWEGVSVFACHANPWQDSSVYVFPERPQALFREVIDAVPAQVIIMGHTHHPMHITLDNRHLLNPGSIYSNRNREERTCAVLSLPEIKFTLYDIDTAKHL